MNIVLCTRDEEQNYLQHYRTKGSKNGVRLYQYKDGSLTPLGREHYGVGASRGSGDNDADEADKKYDSNRFLEGSKAAKEDYERFGKHLSSDMKDLSPKQQKKFVDEVLNRLTDDLEKRKDINTIRDQSEADAEKGRQYEEKGLTDFVTRNFDKFTPDQQKAAGDKLLKVLDSYRTQSDPPDSAYALREWLVDRVYEKVGSINASDYKPGTKAHEVNKKADEIWNRWYQRRDQIASEHGLKKTSHGVTVLKDNKRLKSLLEKDSIWKQLDSDFDRAQDDVMGAILQDLGFSDTAANRSLLYEYGWFD